MVLMTYKPSAWETGERGWPLESRPAWSTQGGPGNPELQDGDLPLKGMDNENENKQATTTTKKTLATVELLYLKQ